MLINLRNAMMAGKRLPYDAEVEYLESSGTQYIDTGIKPGPNTRVEITFAMTTFTANCGLFGARGNATADNNSYNLFIISNNGSRVRWDWSGSGQYQTSEAETSTDATYVLGAAGGNITRNGTTVMSVSASKSAINYPLYVFNFNNVGTPYSTGANARFWSVKIYEGQTLVFDAIPVRKKTVGYLYDRVSGKLFGNAGTGDFVLGPDVVPVEYIESSGTQYVLLPPPPLKEFALYMRYSIYPIGVNANKFLFSAYNPSTAHDFQSLLRLNYSAYGLIDIPKSSGSTRYQFPVFESSVWSTFEIRDGKLSINDSVITDITDNFNDPNGYIGGVYLLTNSAASSSTCPSCRLASFELGCGAIDWIKTTSVRVGTDATSWEGAMMDVLTRRIYRNAGTGAFTYGNDLKYPIPA